MVILGEFAKEFVVKACLKAMGSGHVFSQIDYASKFFSSELVGCPCSAEHSSLFTKRSDADNR